MLSIASDWLAEVDSDVNKSSDSASDTDALSELIVSSSSSMLLVVAAGAACAADSGVA